MRNQSEIDSKSIRNPFEIHPEFMKLSIGYITTPTKTEAKAIVMELLEKELIACANILSGAESYFTWDEEIQKSSESIVFFKTRQKNEAKIIKIVKKMHSYECPCVVFYSIEEGDKDFLKWVERAC